MGRGRRVGWSTPAVLGLVAVLELTGAASARGVQVASVAGVGRDAKAVPMELTRLSGPIEVDGVVGDDEWRGVAPLPLTMYMPVFGGRPQERTEIRVAYDDRALYLSGRMYDTDPAGIRINSLYRDRWNGDDAFAIYVDAFNDNRSAKWFGVTPAGMRFDLLVTDDGAASNDSWDGFWDARTQITDQGWFVEVRIPFSTLGFQAGADASAVLGLTVTRLVSRLNERVTFPAIDPAFEFRAPSQAQDVRVRGVRTSRPTYVTPYVLAARNQSPVLDDGAAAYRTTVDASREVGLDLRYSPSSNLTVDLTANTDFAQVEADDQQVNLDRFPLFFPEKRRFFQERSGLFDFTTAGGVRLFHSRRIGLTDDRFAVPVLGGARVVGRVGDWDVGVLDMRTRSLRTGPLDAVVVPAENFAVGRIQRRILNDFSTLGLLATSRYADGVHDAALGADASVRVVGDNYLTLKWAASFDERDAATVDFMGRSLWNARWQRRKNQGLAYTLEAVRAGTDFDPALGFLPRRDFTTANAVGNWFITPGEGSYFRRIYPGALAFSTFRNADGALESAQYAVWVEWDTKAGGGGWIEPKVFHENVAEEFALDDGVVVPAGAYTYADLQLVWSMPDGDRFRTNVDFRAGTFFDGTRTQVTLTPTWNASRHLELGADYELSRIRFADRGQATDIHLARVRVRAALDARASGNAFVQYNSVSDRLDLNVRLRYNFAEGTDLWLVYNEGLSTDLIDAGPGVVVPPRSQARSLIFKYSHTFGF